MIGLLTQAFPTLALDPEFAWQMWSDLSDSLVERAALQLIQTKRDVYPGTNWVAEVRVTALANHSIADNLTPEQKEAHRKRMAALTGGIGK